jgi:type II secretion system (T2SS) protein G
MKKSIKVCLFILIALTAFFAMTSAESKGTPLPAGGGEPGKAYMDILKKKDSNQQQHCQITEGTINGNIATLFVEEKYGDLSTGQRYLSAGVRMIKVNGAWQVQTEAWQNASSAEANLSMGMMHQISSLVHSYKTHSGSFPNAKDMPSLAAVLSERIAIRKKSEPQFEFPMTDEWGHPFKYVLDPSSNFWIISFGADGKPEDGIYDRNGVPLKASTTLAKKQRTRDADIIFTGVEFVRYPAWR